MYHIYPKSFHDSNGDGVGDLQGIIEKLDYLCELGVEGIWLSPVYDSPMADHGYDVRDYRNIDPLFGDLSDLKLLLEHAHRRGIRVIMDMVLNHTSDQHSWFLESRSSKDNPKRDWYIWRDGRENGPPNNWRAAFGGGAWEWDEKTGQYYLHSFLKEQPDLNWRNKKLRKAFSKVIRYWLEVGVDGFRLDVINMLAKDKRLRDNPRSWDIPHFQKFKFNLNRGRSYKIVRSLRKLVDSYDDRVLIGEIFIQPPGDSRSAASYLGNGKDGLHMAFDFSLMFRRWNARAYFETIDSWYNHIPTKGWPCHVLSNHDLQRSMGRLRLGNRRRDKARILAVLLLTLRGTPFVYYGEEIGMRNARIRPKDLADPVSKRYWPLYSRDRARTPMQWSAEENAGFTAGRPWLPLDHNFKQVNVDIQRIDRGSLLHAYKSLIRVRAQSTALQMGDWIPLHKGDGGVLSYYRRLGTETILVMLNFVNKPNRVVIDDGEWKVLFSTHRPRNASFETDTLTVAGLEAMVLEKLDTNAVESSK
jgi:alpha-glucosidase